MSGGNDQSPATEQQVPGGSVNIIDGENSPPNEIDDLLESTLSGNVFSVGSTPARNSPYMQLEVSASLIHSSCQLIARACANTGAANNFSAASLIRRLGAKVTSYPDSSYNYKDLIQNIINVIREARIYDTLPSEKNKQLLNVLVMDSWDNNNVLIDIETLVVWAIISPAFLLPSSPQPGQSQTEVLAIHGGKSSTSFVRPARRIFTKPDYSQPELVQLALSQLRKHILR